MARAKHTYAVRLAVEGGNKVKANLTSVGTSGERSMRRIDRGSDRASRGLGTLGDRASSLRRNMCLLGGVVAGVAAAGGLALLVKRSIDAADAIAKTADAIGISTDALQELRFALGISGVATEQTDKGLKKFTRNMGELARSSSETQTTLKDLDPTLLSNLRSLNSVEDQLQISFRALASYTDQTKRGAVAQSLFGRSALVMTVGVKNGIEAFEALRQQARDLGIVLDEELLRSAEKTKDQLTVLGTVLSANLNKAILEHAGTIGDLAERFTDSLPTLIKWVETFGRWTGLIEKSPVERLAEIRERIAEIDERMKGLLTRFFNVEIFGHEGPLVAERRQLVAEAAELERLKSELATQLPPSVTPLVMPPVTPPVTPPGDPDDPVKTAEDRARRLLQIEKSLNTQLFQLRHQGADRIRAEHAKLETELEKFKRQLAEPLPAGGTEAEFEKVAEERAQQLERIERLQFGAAAVRDDKLAEIARREKERGEEKADRVKQANKRVVENLGFELEALKKVERERFVDVALRRLSAEATPKLREEVERLAGALYDELKAIEKRNEAEREANQLRTEAKALIESLRTAQEAYADEMARLRELRDLEEGGIDQETFARASEQAYDRMLDASRKWSDGVRRAIRDYVDEAGDAAKQFERVTTRALQASEDAFVQWAQTGKFSAKDLFNTIAEEALRAAYRMAVAKPLDDIFDTIFSAIGGALAGGVGTTPSGTSVPSGPIIIKTHTGGVIGRDAFPTRMVDPAVFDGAFRYHRGGIVGGAGDVPIWAQAGEGVFTPGQMRSLAPVPAVKPEVHVAVNVRNTAPSTRASANVRREPGGDLSLDIVIEQIEGGMARHIGRGEGLAPTLERRYGLNPAAGSFR